MNVVCLFVYVEKKKIDIVSGGEREKRMPALSTAVGDFITENFSTHKHGGMRLALLMLLFFVVMGALGVVMYRFDAGPNMYPVMLFCFTCMMTVLLFFRRDMELKYPNTRSEFFPRLRKSILLTQGRQFGELSFFNWQSTHGKQSPGNVVLYRCLIPFVLIYACLLALAISGRERAKGE